jgi:CO/xanthine dehydrogenase Mo-binding subunit
MLFDIGSHTSRSTYVIGNAAVNAGQKIRQMILERAARRLKVQVDSFDIKEGGIVYGKYYH